MSNDDRNSLAIEAVIATYFRAWNEPSLAGCQALLEECCAPDIAYWDPKYARRGVRDLAERIRISHEKSPQFRVDVTSAIDGYDDTFRYTWVFVSADEKLRLPGLDIAVRGRDGRIATLTSFFGVLDTIPAGARLLVQPRWGA